MTPKEKAKQLLEKYISASVVVEDGENHYHPQPFSLAKQCALIAVDEIMKLRLDNDMYYEEIDDKINYYSYWEEVKQEINNL